MNHVAASHRESSPITTTKRSHDARRGTRSLMRFPHAVAFAVAWCAILVVLALELPAERFDWFFSEEGPVEILSCGFWLLLAGACLTLPGLPRRPWQQGLAAVVAAAREADLHKAFTETSVLKTSYYLKSAAPPAEKLVAALVTLPALVLVIYVLVRGALLIRRTRAWRFDWGRTVMLATGLLAASKLLDRSEAVSAAWFGFHTPMLLHRFIAAFEEGIECLLPILFLVVLLQYQHHFAAAPAIPGGDDR
jgi:hypothetical protein